MTLDEYPELHEAIELPVVELAALLLGRCRRAVPALERALELHGAEYAALVARARALLAVPPGEPCPELVDGAALAALREFLRATAPPAVVRARAAAEALDEVRGQYYFLHFSGRLIDLMADDPVPVADPAALYDAFAGGLTPDPDRIGVPDLLDAPFDATRRLRLCPAGDGRVQLRLDARAAEALRGRGPLRADAALAAIVPNRDLRELTWDPPFEVDGRHYFYGVRPLDPASQRRRVLALLERADRQRAHTVVLPELSVDLELESAVATWHREQARHVVLIVAGSRHLPRANGERGHNQARILTPGGAADRHHRKFSHFAFGAPGQPAASEFIAHEGAALTVHLAPDWSFAVLLCRDFLEPWVLTALAELRVRLVLVPSCSSRTGEFLDRARALASLGQAIVVIANTPHEPGDHTALFARPTQRIAKSLETSLYSDDGLVAMCLLGGDTLLFP